MFNVMQHFNREVCMFILAEICDKWATKQVFAANTRCVGITSTSLNVNTMQQDEFE